MENLSIAFEQDSKLDPVESELLKQLSGSLAQVETLLASLNRHRSQSSLLLSQRKFCQESGYSYGAVREQMHHVGDGENTQGKVLIEGIHFHRAESGRYVFKYKAACDAMSKAPVAQRGRPSKATSH